MKIKGFYQTHQILLEQSASSLKPLVNIMLDCMGLFIETPWVVDVVLGEFVYTWEKCAKRQKLLNIARPNFKNCFKTDWHK